MIQVSTYNSLWGFFRLWKCYQNAFIVHWNEINETQKITNKILLPNQEAWNVKELIRMMDTVEQQNDGYRRATEWWIP